MTRHLTAAILLAVLTAPAGAQPPADRRPAFTFTRIPAPAEPGAISLYPGVPPGSENSRAVERWARVSNGPRVVRNVTRPTITPFLPDPAKATGAAVIVAPGGGYAMLAMDDEGWPVARWLADRGIAAFVLKYRLNETPDDEAEFQRAMGGRMAAIAAGGPPPSEPRAVADAQQALRVVRANAGRWRIDPARVGMIGFSAGARTTLATVTAHSGERPSFIGYIYGAMAPVSVPADAPPMFSAVALDDGLYGKQGFGVIESWQKAGRPVELHAYEKGEHGFGLGRPGTTSTLMPEQFIAWLEGRGLLKQGAAR